MSASDDAPYFSRFLMKFIEIFAAGLATAVSGYLIANLAGALSSSTPAAVVTAVQVAPRAAPVPSSAPAKLAVPASGSASEQRPAAREANAPADAEPAPGTGTESSHGDTAKAVIAPKRLETDKHLEGDKHLEADTSAAASAAESKRDQAENKHAQDAVLARIRAALAKNNAKRTNPPDTPQPAGNGPRLTTAIGSQPPPVDKRPSAAPGPSSVTLASPNSANPPPPPIHQQVQPPVEQQVQQTIQQAPTEPTPLTTVEITSRPVATQTAPAPAPAPTSQDDSGMFSGLDRLRHDPLATHDDAPRPPMPVGQ
jgi:Na+-translocating ferredoxin:NAD+ oxidoreductase subunit C